MPTVEERLAHSLTAETTALIPHLPYLLQDLWELGSSPRDIVALLAAHVAPAATASVLDLACGKGSVSIAVAKAFGCPVRGVDMLAAFVADAAPHAREHGVAARCTFLVGDVNEAVQTERNHDVVIFGAAGDVLGTPAATVAALRATVRAGGHIVIDDAYGPREDGRYPTRAQWLRIFAEAGVALVGERPADPDEIAATNRTNQACIASRAAELARARPELAEILAGYVRSQQAECDELEGEFTGVTWLLRVE